MAFKKPDPQHRRHALAVCKLCKVAEDKARKLVHYANGDWNSKYVWHFCTFGCCSSVEDRVKTSSTCHFYVNLF